MSIFTRGWELFQSGGMVMYLILFCSLAVVTIFIERYMYYRSAQKLSPEFMSELGELLEAGKYDAAIENCRADGGIVARVAETGLISVKNENSNAYTILESEAGLAVAKLRKNINHLESIVTVSPLLGLLGTIFGMMDTFKIMDMKSGEPMAITGGIGEALIATAFGLCVATLALAAHSYYIHRLDGIITNVEEMCTVIISKVK